MELSKKTTILFSPSLHERLSGIARQQGVSLGELVRRACEAHYGIEPQDQRDVPTLHPSQMPAQIGSAGQSPGAAHDRRREYAPRSSDSQAVRAVDVVGALMHQKESQATAARFRKRRNLRDLRFPDVVQELARGRLSGQLVVQHEDVSKTVIVRDGNLVFAQSSDPDDRLGDILLVSGRITLDHYLDVQRGLQRDRRAGGMFVEIGAIQPQELATLVVEQTKATLSRLFAWTEGEFWVADTADADHEPISLKSTAPDTIMDGIARIDAWSQIELGIGGAEEPYRRAADFAARIAQMTLTDEQRGMLDLLEHSQSVESVCEYAPLASIDVCRTLWAFKVIGAIETGERDFADPSPRGPGREPGGTTGVAAAAARRKVETSAPEQAPRGITGHGDLKTDDFPSVVREVRRSRTSGVLVVARKGVVKRLVLRDGRIVFALSSDPDDRLGEQLLVQRKISLRQYREANLGMREGQRLGASLVEMGAIDADELITLIVAQCQATVYSLFQWTEGDYWIEAAPADEREPISLKLSTADVILGGIQRIDAWSRIEAGLGGLRTRYRRTDDWDARLAGATLSAGQRRLLELLTQPWDTPAVCRVVDLPSIELCRTLWAFRVIGAIEPFD